MLEKGTQVAISIHNVNGSLVRTLDLGYKQPGVYIDKTQAAYWDGRNDHGEKLASGIYFVTLKADNFVSTRKVVILR